MKKLLTLVFATGTYLCSAQQAFYDVTVGNGNGIRFWQSDQYKIHMGNASEYLFGPVTDYSIKTNMSSGTPGRGWTWGVTGQVPVVAINSLGNMQIAGTFQSAGNIVNSNTANGWIGLTGDLPGYSVGSYPTLKSNYTYLYFSGGGKYSGYLGGSADAVLGLNDTGANARVLLNTNGSSYFNGGNIGIGTTTPSDKLSVVGGAITLDADQPLRGGGKWLISGNSSQVTVGTANPNVNLRFDAGATGRIFVNGTSGYVGIGTSSPDAPLSVSGQVHAQEVKVSIAVPGPDYVFEKEYKLTSLEDIKTYIDQNKHLPEVPSAREMEKNGVQLGEMNMLLLKKIEELTLYVIELKKRDEAQQLEIEKLKNKNK